MVIENAVTDARFARNPFVTGPPNIRFYAGAPLVSSTGFCLGTLCVVDRKPRTFSDEQCSVLANLTEIVVREMEIDAALASGMQQRTALVQVWRRCS